MVGEIAQRGLNLISPITLLYMLPMAEHRSFASVVAIRYVLPVFVDDIMFLSYNGPYSGMNFTTKD